MNQTTPTPKPAPRLRTAQRDQLLLLPAKLDDLIPYDHEARALWQFVERLDLTPYLDLIRAVQGHPGRDATDPKILVALWLYATTQGVSSSRQLEELCQHHHVYQWLRGGVWINYHTLSDFHTARPELLDQLLIASVAALRAEGLVSLRRVAQDSLKTRASAGSNSFHRQATLEKHLHEAEAHVRALRAAAAADPAGSRRRQRRAQERAAEERRQRIEQALQHLPEVAAKKRAADREQARVSTTDAAAHLMKMPDGGYQPAYGVQFATATDAQVIVGVAVSTSGSDLGQLLPMVEQLRDDYGEVPAEVLADGNFAKHADITALAGPEFNCTVYAPVKQPNNKRNDPHAPRRGDSAAVAAWRQRMRTAEAQAIYKERASVAECVNAQARNRGLRQLRVRGPVKVLAVALWYALAHNVRRGVMLRAGVAVAG